MMQLNTYTEIIPEKDYLQWIKLAVLDKKAQITYGQLFSPWKGLTREILNQYLGEGTK